MQDSSTTRVTVGLRVPDSFGIHILGADDLLARCVTLGIDTIELDAPTLETWLGAPPEPALLRMPEDDFEHGLLPIEEEVFREEIELGRATFAAQVRQWRLSLPLTAPVTAPPAATLSRSSTSIDDLRHRFDRAGVRIAILAWDGLAPLSDEEVDYAFEVARQLGVVALATDLSAGGPKRLGAFAEKHQTVVGFHGDEGTSSEALEAALGPGTFTGISIDVTSWAIGGGSPLPFLDRHAPRITHVHLKDPRANNKGPAWSRSAPAPGRELLGAMRDHQWTFPAIVAFESDLPDGSGRMAELAAYLNGLRLIT